ncbi:MAG: hypothetical protein ACOYUZ_04605 [Patescibacteria group bacterium]
MRRIHIFIIGGLAILTSVFAVAMLSYAGGSGVRIPAVSQSLEKIFPSLTPPSEVKLPEPTDEIVKLLQDREPEVPVITQDQKWKKFTFTDYQLEIPADWQAEWPETENGYVTLLFKDGNGEVVAVLQSPPPVTGYEVWRFENQDRSETKDGVTYNYHLAHGTVGEEYAKNFKLKDLHILFAQIDGFKAKGDALFDPARGIQISSNKDGMREIFDHIYETIQARDKWKLFKGDVFSFQYPSNWTVKEDAGMGHRWAEFMDNNNQRIAMLECPIVETGYEGFDLQTKERTLQRADGTFDFKYWHGDDVEFGRPDMEIIFMENLSPDEGNEGGFGGNSCQLFTLDNDSQADYQRIFQTLNATN